MPKSTFFFLHTTILSVSAMSWWNTIWLLVWRTNPLIWAASVSCTQSRVMNISYGLVAKPLKFKNEWTVVQQPIQRIWRLGRNMAICSGGTKCPWVCIFVKECINCVQKLHVTWTISAVLTLGMYLCCRYWILGVIVLFVYCSLNWSNTYTVFVDSSCWYWVTYTLTIFTLIL